MAAIGAVFSKNGKKIIKSVTDALDGKGMFTEDDLFHTLDAEQQLVLFGKDRKDAYEHQTDTNSNSD
jgi:hypothetical protein